MPLPVDAFVERPPQFVVISFDNCSELERWQELSDFLDEMNDEGDRVHFTFFVSGTNFLPQAMRAAYRGPGQVAGLANIPFGGSAEDVRRRTGFINRLHAAGNEIASHAVGHFDGRQWSAADWAHEFRTYGELFRQEAGFAFPIDRIVGFRAPYLSRSSGLYVALQQHRFRYDASGVGDADSWPEKRDGLWRFNLANLRIAGSGKYTLSMDYNFLVAQSGVAGNPKFHARYRDEMFRTYLNYFRANYFGNRAPIHIGHHFSPMQGGVYNEALKDFARAVCRLPEVRCVTYGKLADYLDGVGPNTLQALQRGAFPRAVETGLDFALSPSRERL
jgi:peptidoglycan/xylan/chitin deacetylase (PgdA/CDA1 family)